MAGISTLAGVKNRYGYFPSYLRFLLLLHLFLTFVDNNFLNYIEFAVDLAVFGLLIWMVLVKVFEGGAVTIHRIIGSIVVYMLIGDVWAQIYQFIYT